MEIEILNKFENMVSEIEKELNLDLRVETNYSNTTSSLYPTISFHNLLDEDGDDLYMEITSRISDHSTRELSKDLMFYFNEFEDENAVKNEIFEAILFKIENLTFTRNF